MKKTLLGLFTLIAISIGAQSSFAACPCAQTSHYDIYRPVVTGFACPCNSCAKPAPCCNSCATPAPCCDACAKPAPCCNSCAMPAPCCEPTGCAAPCKPSCDDCCD